MCLFHTISVKLEFNKLRKLNVPSRLKGIFSQTGFFFFISGIAIFESHKLKNKKLMPDSQYEELKGFSGI